MVAASARPKHFEHARERVLIERPTDSQPHPVRDLEHEIGGRGDRHLDESSSDSVAWIAGSIPTADLAAPPVERLSGDAVAPREPGYRLFTAGMARDETPHLGFSRRWCASLAHPASVAPSAVATRWWLPGGYHGTAYHRFGGCAARCGAISAFVAPTRSCQPVRICAQTPASSALSSARMRG